MPTHIVATKLYIPAPRPAGVLRSRLTARLRQGLHRKLTLIAAPAGFGKTTLVSEWVAVCGRPTIWLSVDKGDSDPARFLTYLIAGLQTVAPHIGAGMVEILQSPQQPPVESLLTALLNELACIPGDLILVLDDYQVLDSKPVDSALAFLLEHLPPQMHLVIATRENPRLPLARLRARGQLVELRTADLRFTLDETAEFLNRVMGLQLSANDIAALEARTEGWVAGLQLAALSMQGHHDAAGFVRSFSGSHQYVLDYLLEEVLHQQPEHVQAFLLRTSILDRMCGPLCDAVLGEGQWASDDSASLFAARPSSLALEELERANLFIVPLDNERRWYRYHHLFADLLRQRLDQPSGTPGGRAISAAELHIRASEWYEANGLEIEAFHHAVAANDIERAERLMDGKGMPMHFHGAVAAILGWLASLPAAVLDARPALWVRYAEILLVSGQTTGVEEKLLAAEAALQGAELDDQSRHLIGHIATARATLALTRYQADAMLAQSRRALAYLRPDDLAFRATANWTAGTAYFDLGDRAAARQAIGEAIALSREAGNIFTAILAAIALGQIQEADNQLYLAAETYRHVLQLAGDRPQQIIYEAHLGLARISYEWDDLDAAEQHGQQSLQLARQYDSVIDRFVVCEVFLARLKLARGDRDSQALAHHAQGAAEVTAQLLGQALALAEPGGFVRLFVDEGVAMLRLLQATASRGIALEYAQRLLAACSRLAAEQAAHAALVEPLSEREQEVLQHIAAGRTNREIADRLYLSLNTIKVHARNIFGKLGVTNRTQAVARAREVGALPR